MNSLEALGVKPGTDEHHGLMSEYIQAEDFFKAANVWLEKASPVVVNSIFPHLEDYFGRWNPGGFMVFPLGMHEDLGSIRLHVYPLGIRETSHGPNIHNHAWHLASKVLAGNYVDVIYDLEDQGIVTNYDPLNQDNLFRIFSTRRLPSGQDELVTEGRVVRPVPTLRRSVSTGSTHNIEAGIYHLTIIPDDELTATLVVDSPAFTNKTGILLATGQERITRNRLIVDEASILLAKEQLLSV